MNKYAEFKSKIDRKLNIVDAKLGFMNEGIKGLRTTFKEFRFEMDDFIDFTADSNIDHEKRISELEKKVFKRIFVKFSNSFSSKEHVCKL